MAALLIEKITINPEIVSGQPHISGTRFTVKQIVVWHEYMSMSVEEIAHTYLLEQSDIHAALAYYFDNMEVIQQDIRDEKQLVESLKKQFPSKLIQANA